MITRGVFDGVIGHERILDLLIDEIDAPANAYLFVGATGVGKATVAHRFATALLCPDGARHDKDCDLCRRARTGNHPDLVQVQPEGRQSLGVDQARTTVQQAVMAPMLANRKVFLFEEAGSMTEQAANALLKTLEETTPTTVFLLVAESEDELPPTVASRCRTVHFGRVDSEVLRGALVNAGVDPERADALCRMAGGRPGLALVLESNPAVAAYREAWLSIPLRVTDRPGESFLLAKEMLDAVDPLVEGAQPPEAQTTKEAAERARRRARQALLATGLEILASWYADSATVQLGGPVKNRDVPVAALTRLAPSSAVRRADRVLAAVTDLQANLRPQLLLADLFAELGGVE